MSWDNDAYVGSTVWIVDYIGDLFFVVDIVLRAKFFEFNDGTPWDKQDKQTEASWKRLKIFGHYRNKKGRFLASNMFMDVMSVIPFELCVMFVPSDQLGSTFNKVQIISLLRFCKLLRMRRISHHLNSLDSFNDDILQIPVNHNALKLMQMVVLIIFSAHWFGCLWFLLARLQGTDDTWAHGQNLLPTLCTNGTAVDDGDCAREIMDQYVSSVYWATFTLTTVGYGDITPSTNSEQYYAIVVLIIGTFIYTFIIAILEEIVAQVDVTSSLNQQRIEEVKSYLLIRRVSPSLQDKVMDYYDILWSRRKGATANEVMKFLSPTLQESILLHDLNEPLRGLVGLAEFSAGDFILLLRAFVPEMFLPGDVLYDRGSCATDLLVIADGDVMLTTDGRVSLKNETKGSVLGYAEFINRTLHSMMAKATSMANVYSLSRPTFEQFLVRVGREREWAEEEVADDDGGGGGGRASFKAPAPAGEVLLKVKAYLEKHNMTDSLAKNVQKGGKMATMMGNDESQVKHKKLYVVRHNSSARTVWDVVFFIYIMFQVFVVPIGFSFQIQWHYYLSCMDAFLMLNVYMNMQHFSSMARNGAILTERKDFRHAYITSSTFVMDLLATVPVDLISHLMGEDDARVLYLLRVAKLLYISRIPTLIQRFVDVLEEQQIDLNSGIVNLFRMFIFIVLCCHVLACVFYYSASLKFVDDDPSWVMNDPLSWGPENAGFVDSIEAWGYVTHNTTGKRSMVGNPGLGDISSRYVRAFYWSTYTITTVGYGDVKPVNVTEKILAICGMLIGAVLCDAGITAILTSYINNQDLNAGKNSRRTKCLKMYMAHRGISRRLQTKILEYFVFVKIEQQDLDEHKILSEMPSSLRHHIVDYLCYWPMRRHLAYKKYSDAFVHSLVKHMEPYVAMPYEWLFCRWVYF
jgi:hypothetical protein